MAQVEESIEVAVPVTEAYQQWTRFEEFPRFMAGVERIDRPAPELTHWVVRVAGAVREFDARITEQLPDERIAWTAVAGEPHQSGVVTFHRIDPNRSRVMLQLDYAPQGLVETVGDALGFVQRQVIDDLKCFKDFIESRTTGAGPA
ncbi:SRPBCC family protein [Kitasatospora sp. NPDC052896]|uniref:SRPBCC family protein n=1 Tax=Kitasatospora sp. NPDC052896 TaxID=3364061 RepID=UPI0037CB9715